jgi:hypothetical protein
MSNGRPIFFPTLDPGEVPALAGIGLEREHKHWADRDPYVSRGPAKQDDRGYYRDLAIQQTSEAMGLEFDPGKAGTEKGYRQRVVDWFHEEGGQDISKGFSFGIRDRSSQALDAIGPAYRPFVFDYYKISNEVRRGIEDVFANRVQRPRETFEDFEARYGGLQQPRLKVPGARPGVVPNFADRKNLTGLDVLKISAKVLGITAAELFALAPGPTGVLKSQVAKVLLSGLRRQAGRKLGTAASRSFRAGAHLGLRPGATPLVETAMESTEGMPGAARFAIAAGAGLLGDPSGTSVIRGIASGARRGFEGAGAFGLTKASRIPAGQTAAPMRDLLKKWGEKLSQPGVARRQTKQEELDLYRSLVDSDTAMRSKLREGDIPSGPTIPEAMRNPGGLISSILGDGPGRSQMGKAIFQKASVRASLSPEGIDLSSIASKDGVMEALTLTLETIGRQPIELAGKPLEDILTTVLETQGPVARDLVKGMLSRGMTKVRHLSWEGAESVSKGGIAKEPIPAAGSIEQIGIRSVEGQLVIRIEGVTDETWRLLHKPREGLNLDKVIPSKLLRKRDMTLGKRTKSITLRDRAGVLLRQDESLRPKLGDDELLDPKFVDKDTFDLRIKVDDGKGPQRIQKVFHRIDNTAAKASAQAVSPNVSADLVNDVLKLTDDLQEYRSALAEIDTKWQRISEFIKQFDAAAATREAARPPHLRAAGVIKQINSGRIPMAGIGKTALQALKIGSKDFDADQLARLRVMAETLGADRQTLLTQIASVTPPPNLLPMRNEVVKLTIAPKESLETALLKSVSGTSAIVDSQTRKFFAAGSDFLVAKGWSPIKIDQDSLQTAKTLAAKWRKLKPDHPQRSALALQYHAAAARIVPDSDELRLLEALYDGGPPPAKYAEIFEDLQEAILMEARDMAFIDPQAAIPRLFDNPNTFRGIWDDLGPGFEVPSLDWREVTDVMPGSFRDWLSKGYVPGAGGNPYHLFANRRLAGIQYRGKVRLAYRARTNGLTKTREEFALLTEARKKKWRVPDIGAPFKYDIEDAGPVAGDAIETVFKGSREIYVPVKLARELEYVAGKQAKLIIPGGFNILKPMAFTANFLKAVKLQLSLFQTIDFQMRSNFLAFSPSEIIRGTPLKLPSLLGRALWAQINPNAITHIRDVMKADPVTSRVLRHGLATTDESIFQGVYEAGTLTMKSIGDEGASLIDKMPTAQARGVLKRIKMGSEYFQNRLFEAVYPTYQHWAITEVIVPALRRAHKGLNEDEIASMAATETGKLFSSLASWQTVLRASPEFSALMRQLIFSTNETEALLKQAFSVFRGPNKRFWANYYAGFFVFNSMMGNAIHYWATGKPLPAEAYAPIVISPKYGGAIASGVGFFRPTIPGIKGRGDTELTLDLPGQTETVLSFATGPLTALKSRFNVLPAAVFNQIKGTSFNNTPAEGFVGRMRMAAEDLLYPISVGSWVGASKPEAFLGSETRLGRKGNIFQASGFGVRAERTDQFLDRLTIEYGFTNNSTGLPATKYEELWPSQRATLKKESKTAFDELRTRREISAKRGDEYAQAIVKAEELEEGKVKALNQLGVQASQDGMPAQTFLKQAGDIETYYMGKSSEIYSVFEDDEDRDVPEDKFARARDAMFKVFREIDPLGSFRRDEVQVEIQRLGEELGWDEDILDYFDKELGLAPEGLNDYMQGFYDGKKLLRRHGWWDLYKQNPIFTSSPQLLTFYENWLELGKLNLQNTLLRSSPGMHQLMKSLDKVVDMQKNQYLIANPEVDAYLVTFRGSNPRTPLGRAAKLKMPGADPFEILTRSGGRTLSTNDIQKLLTARVRTLDQVADMTNAQVRVILGQGYVRDNLQFQAFAALEQMATP